MIGLLIGMLVPSLKQSMDLAAATVCKHNLREVGNCLRLYRVENDGWLPTVDKSNFQVQSVAGPDPWFLKLFPTYMADLTVLSCPEDPYRGRLARATTSMRDAHLAQYASYGISSFITTAGGGVLADTDRRRPTRPLDTILVADIGPDRAAGRAQVAGVIGPIRNAGLLRWDDGFNPHTGRKRRPWLTQRHTIGVNVLTLAGGVREARTADLMRKSLDKYYEDCAAGGCTFCNVFRVPHYSFAQDHLYWWTGPMPLD